MANTYDINGNLVQSTPTAPPLSPPTQNDSSPDIIQQKIRNSAQHYGVDPNLALAVAKQESSFNPNAKSKVGAVGVMQLMPETAQSYGVAPEERTNPDKNIDAGMRYLADLQKKHAGDKAKMLIEYNSGPGNVNKNFEDLPGETQGYLTNILGPGASIPTSPRTYDISGNPLITGAKQITPEQKQAKRNLNETLSGPGQTAREAAMYAPEVLGTLGGLIPGYGTTGSAIGSGLGEIVAGSAEHGVPTKEDLVRAVEGAGYSLALGSLMKLPGVLKSQVLKNIENKAGKASDIIENARQDLTKGIPSGSTQGEQDVLKAKLAPVKSEENAAWEKVNDRMDKASHVFDVVSTDPSTGQQISTPTPVRGPIKLSPNSLQYIREEKNRLEQIISKFPTKNNVDAYQKLSQAEKALITDKNGDVYVPFDAVKSLRSDIGKNVASEQEKSLRAGKSLGIQSGSRIQSGLRNTLGDDIDSSLYDIGGADALKEYGNAVGMTKTRVKASIFDKIIAKRTNEATGMLDVDGAINDVMNATSKDGRQFTAAERNFISNALKAVKNVSPQYDGGMKFSNGQWLFTGYYATRHPLKFVVSVATKDLFEKALESPKYARILSQLPSAPKNSSQTQMMTRSLFKGMLSSVPAEMIAPSGMRVKAHIDENGEPKPDFQFGTAQ